MLYDNITTSYELNLPSDYYWKAIQRELPSAADSNKQPWFIRPHHLESTTRHASSIRDDFLNTRYYTFYDRDKHAEKTDKELALENIESQLAILKSQSQKLAAEKWGINHDDRIEELQPIVSKEALRAYEAFITDRQRFNDKDLCINAYERILNDHRRWEGGILNKHRSKEIDKNRPPNAGWYERKDKEFANEVYRNRVDLKPQGQNRDYLATLRDPSIY